MCLVPTWPLTHKPPAHLIPLKKGIIEVSIIIQRFDISYVLDTTTASIRLVELFNHLLVIQNCADLSFTAFTPIFGSLSDILNTLYLIFSEVNRSGGYGLEVPCIYRLYGPKTYVERARTMLSGDQSRVQSECLDRHK